MVRFTAHAIKPFAVVLLLFIGAGCHTVGHSIFCKDSVRTQATSPDGRYMAETVESDCGATEHATVVRVRRVRGLFRDRRDVFATSGENEVRVTWDWSQRLTISCPDCSSRNTTTGAESKWRDVLIQYALPERKD